MEQIFAAQAAGVGVKLGLLILVLTVTQAAQALACRWAGDHGPAQAGQLSLWPQRHADAFGSVLIPALLLIASGGRWILGSGKPLQSDPSRLGRLSALLVALASPLAHALLAGLAFVLLLLSSPFVALDSTPYLLLDALILISLLLGLFTLLPIPGLAGAEVVRFLLPGPLRRGWDTATRYGLGLVLMIALFVAVWQQYLDLTPALVWLDDLREAVRRAFLEARLR